MGRNIGDHCVLAGPLGNSSDPENNPEVLVVLLIGKPEGVPRFQLRYRPKT